MNALEDQIVSLLKALEKHGALQYLTIIGSWTTLFYQEYFDDADYHPVIRTTDIDFLVPQKPPKNLRLNIPGVLEDLGFYADINHDGWVTFQKPDLHIEFLWPRVGPHSDEVISLPELGIKVRPLRFMWLLVHYSISCSYKGIKFRVPHPAAFGLHKLIISTRRGKATKRDNDRQQAETVLTAMRKNDDLKLLKEIISKLSKKERTAVGEAIRGRPLLEEALSISR